MQRLKGVGFFATLRDRPAGIDPRIGVRHEPTVTAGYADPSTYPIASPWSSSDLQRLVFEDIFGTDIPPNTRATAMRLPAVARARNLLCSTIGRLPLVQLDRRQHVPAVDADDAEWEAFYAAQPSWTQRADDGTSPELRIALTVDDLIFYGWSCWWRRNGSDGFPIAVGRIPQDEWEIDQDTMSVLVNGVPAGHDANGYPTVILIPGLHEGVLSYGRDVIEDTRVLYRNVRARLINPVPQLELHQTGGEPLTETEIDALISRWAAARQGKNGGVGFTNEFVELHERGVGGDSQLMIDARNAASLDLARMVGVAASRIDSTADKASLNYETTTGRNQEFVDFDLALYMTPITARLSLDDVSPRGKRVRFDLTDFVESAPSVTGPDTVQD